MTSVFGISLSGLNAAAKRFEISAQNVANRDSTKVIKNGQTINEPYHTQQVHSISNALGGVITKVTDTAAPTTITFDPTAENADENGASRIPNVDIETEMVNQRVASYDFKANLKMIKAQNDLLDSLLDIKS